MSDLFSNQRWVSFKNESGETMPPFAVFSVVGPGFSAHGTPLSWKYVRGVKYDSSAEPPNRHVGILAINGPLKVLDGHFGKCTFASDGPAWCLTEPTAALSVGSTLGPVDHQWYVSPASGSEFIAISEKSSTGAAEPVQPALVMRRQHAEIFLMQSAETSVVLGRYHSPSRGFQSTGEAVFVWSTAGGSVPDSSTRVPVDFSYLNAMVFPGSYFYAAFRVNAPDPPGIGLYAISGGVINFTGTAGASGSGLIPVVVSSGLTLHCNVLFNETVSEDNPVGVALFHEPLIAWIKC